MIIGKPGDLLLTQRSERRYAERGYSIIQLINTLVSNTKKLLFVIFQYIFDNIFKYFRFKPIF